MKVETLGNNIVVNDFEIRTTKDIGLLIRNTKGLNLCYYDTTAKKEKRVKITSWVVIDRNN